MSKLPLPLAAFMLAGLLLGAAIFGAGALLVFWTK